MLVATTWPSTAKGCRIQPNEETQQKQLTLWRQLLVQYCEATRVCAPPAYRLARADVCAVSRLLSAHSAKPTVSRGHASPRSPACRHLNCSWTMTRATSSRTLQLAVRLYIHHTASSSHPATPRASAQPYTCNSRSQGAGSLSLPGRQLVCQGLVQEDKAIWLRPEKERKRCLITRKPMRVWADTVLRVVHEELTSKTFPVENLCSGEDVSGTGSLYLGRCLARCHSHPLRFRCHSCAGQ